MPRTFSYNKSFRRDVGRTRDSVLPLTNYARVEARINAFVALLLPPQSLDLSRDEVIVMDVAGSRAKHAGSLALSSSHQILSIHPTSFQIREAMFQWHTNFLPKE